MTLSATDRAVQQLQRDLTARLERLEGLGGVNRGRDSERARRERDAREGGWDNFDDDATLPPVAKLITQFKALTPAQRKAFLAQI